MEWENRQKELIKARLGGGFTPSQKKQIHKNNRDKYGGENRCEICKRPTIPPLQNKKNVRTPDNNMEADHIIPYSKGGRSDIDNSQSICRKCNRDKGDKMP